MTRTKNLFWQTTERHELLKVLFSFHLLNTRAGFSDRGQSLRLRGRRRSQRRAGCPRCWAEARPLGLGTVCPLLTSGIAGGHPVRHIIVVVISFLLFAWTWVCSRPWDWWPMENDSHDFINYLLVSFGRPGPMAIVASGVIMPEVFSSILSPVPST